MSVLTLNWSISSWFLLTARFAFWCRFLIRCIILLGTSWICIFRHSNSLSMLSSGCLLEIHNIQNHWQPPFIALIYNIMQDDDLIYTKWVWVKTNLFSDLFRVVIQKISPGIKRSIILCQLLQSLKSFLWNWIIIPLSHSSGVY